MSDTNINGSAPEESPTNAVEQTEAVEAKPKHAMTRRQVLAMAGCGVAGLVVGGVLASWGVTSQSIASGRIDIRHTATKMIVTDRARCSGCQRCEMMCTLKNDGRVCQNIARGVPAPTRAKARSATATRAHASSPSSTASSAPTRGA